MSVPRRFDAFKSVPVLVFVLALFLSLAVPPAAAGPLDGKEIGVVLMHGKGGRTKLIDGLAGALRSAGARVETPLMPWSRDRIYDRTYDDSMKEIDAAVERLKAAGAKRIVVAGHSMGANASLGYGARRDGLAAVVLLAYGHVPSNNFFRNNFGADVARAKALIDAGKGAERGEYPDLNQGERFTRTVRADVFWSWFAPDGPASDRNNAQNIRPGVPVLWVSADSDRVSDYGRRLIWDRLPGNPKNRFEVISSNHVRTPEDAKEIVVEWLSKLD